LGIGDWGLGIGPNPQSPIPNPHLHYKVNFIINIAIKNYIIILEIFIINIIKLLIMKKQLKIIYFFK